MAKRWLVKSDPEHYSFDDLVRSAHWERILEVIDRSALRPAAGR
jgi:predicted RNA-binding protein with PUA-like domain